MTDSNKNITPEDIGTLLRTLREKHGYSLSDLSRLTKISIDVLKSLEEGNWKKLGTKFLVKNFVKSYCAVLGEPYEELVGFIETSDGKYWSLSKFRTLPLEKRKAIVKNKSKYAFYFIVMFISICMTAGGIYVYRHNAIKSEPQMPVMEETVLKIPEKILETNENTEPNTNSTSLEKSHAPSISLVERQYTTEKRTPVTSSSNSQNEKKGNEQTKRPPTSTHKLVIEAIEKTWVKVWVDKSRPISKLMNPGEIMRFEVSQSARMIIGNAGGIRISWDGKIFSNIGKKGAVLRLSIPEELFKKFDNE